MRKPTWQMLAASFVLILVVVATVVIWRARHAYDLPSPGRDPGKAAAERYVFEFVAALNSNDSGLLGEVTGGPADAPTIQEALRLFGGRDLIDVEVAIVHAFRYHYQTWITAQAGDGSMVEMYQVIVWTGERFRSYPLYTGPPPPR